MMKSSKFILFLFFTIGFSCSNLFCQEKDTIFIFPGEDNWKNVERYKELIINKVDSNMKGLSLKLSSSIIGKVVVSFTITDTGGITDCKILKGFSPEVNKEVLKTLSVLCFDEAAVFSYSGKPYSVNFTLPINLNIIYHYCPR
ncbi:MAG: energy transducer TonB [Paludibacter sp.]